MDEALRLLERYGPEYSHGLANHAPMAAEALVALGRPEAVLPWVDRYRRKLEGPPAAASPIRRDAWREALGDPRRMGDWTAFFGSELSERPWREVVAQWAPRLAPGSPGAAAHGLLRAAHAVRSIAAGETPQRRRELGAGLGYWAARYLELPAAPAAAARPLPVPEALRKIEFLPKSGRGEGLIVDSLRRLSGLPSFLGVLHLVDAEGDPGLFLSSLTKTFVRVYLGNPERDAFFSLLHAVTGASAMRLLLPFLARESVPAALRHAWLTAAGLYAAFGHRPDREVGRERPEDPAELTDRAIATGDEHAIKLTEACLREHALDPDPAYLLAAGDAVQRFAGRSLRTP